MARGKSRRGSRAIHSKASPCQLDAPTLARLDADSRIRTVEPDGQVALCGQTNGLGILRMGITNFPVAQINGRDERIDVDVAVLDTGIQIDTTNLATNAVFKTTIHPAHPDLNVVQAVGFADRVTTATTGTGTARKWPASSARWTMILGWWAWRRACGCGTCKCSARQQKAWANVLAGLDYIAQHADQIEVVNASISLQRWLDAIFGGGGSGVGHREPRHGVCRGGGK